MGKTPPPPVPRGPLTEQAQGLFYTRFEAWAKEMASRVSTAEASLATLSAASGVVTPTADGEDFGSYRHKPGNSSLSPWNIAGSTAGTALGATGTLAANLIYAFPFVAPKRGGTLTSIGYEGANANGVVRMGCWGNAADDNLYPSSLLYDGGNVANAAAVKTYSPTLALTAGALYWVGWIIDDATGSARKLAAGLMTAMLGAPLGAATMNHGITVTATGGAAFASTFPAGGAYIDVGASAAPALGYKVS